MQRLQAFKFELRPNGEQQRNMRRFAGSCRFVFNKALALQKERYGRGEKKLGYVGCARNSPRGATVPRRRGSPMHLSTRCNRRSRLGAGLYQLLRQAGRVFACVECGFEDNADVVGRDQHSQGGIRPLRL